MTTLAPPAPVAEPQVAPAPRRVRRRPAAGSLGLVAAGTVVGVVLLAALVPDLLAPQDPLEISL